MVADPLGPLLADTRAFDAAVAATPGIDRFCSQSAWVLAAHRALMPPRIPWIRRTEAGWLALAVGFEPVWGRYLQPLEALWGFASGLAGEDPVALAESAADTFMRAQSEWDLLLLSGLPPGSPLVEGLRHRLLAAGLRVGLGPPTLRRAASLEGGVDGFLSRRSSSFRRNLRSARRRAKAGGVVFEHVGENAEAILDRALALERLSWKGREGVGMEGGSMAGFYREMLPRLDREGALRAVFARREGMDIAFVFGAVAGDTYRGLQMSYDAAERGLSLGTLVQMALIERLVEEGVAVYDMGQDIDYKRRWTDGGLETVTLIAAP